MTDSKTDPRLVEAFRQMWGSFPDPMVLLYKDRTILAQNDAAAAQPWGAVGDRCFSVNPDSNGKVCQGCQANAAMKSGRSETCEGEFKGALIRGYWIPVQGTSDVFIHGYSPLKPALPVVA
jgi:hypothetical protein